LVHRRTGLSRGEAISGLHIGTMSPWNGNIERNAKGQPASVPILGNLVWGWDKDEKKIVQAISKCDGGMAKSVSLGSSGNSLTSRLQRTRILARVSWVKQVGLVLSLTQN